MTVPESSDEASRKAGRSSAFALIGTAVGSIANFAVLLVVTAAYGQTLFGVFSAVTALFQLSGVLFRLGAEIGATYMIAREDPEDRPPTARAQLVVALVPVVIISLAVMAVGLLASESVARLLADSADEADYAAMLRIVSIALPFATIGEVLLGASRGFGSMNPTVIASNFGRQGGQLITVGAAALFTSSPQALAVAWAVPYILPVVYPAWWLWRRALATAATQPAEWGVFWRYTSPQAANAAVQGGLEKADIILLNSAVGADPTAVYSLANRFVHVVVLARYAINVSQSAVFARQFTHPDAAALNAVVSRVAGWTALLCGPVLWLLMIFPDAILTVLGAEYGAGSTALSILAGAMLLSLAAGPAEGLLLMSGASGLAFVNNAIALAVNLGLNIVLIPRYGPSGAAIAWAISLTLSRILAVVPLNRRHGVLAITGPLSGSLAIAGVSFGLVGAVARLFGGDEMPSLIVAAVIGVALFLLAVRRWSSTVRLDELIAGLRPAS